jgi:hypothetical protein
VVDNDGDEFFDATAEPSSPSFLSRASSKSSSAHDSHQPFSETDVENVSSREASFKDAPGPSELWAPKDQGTICIGQPHRDVQCFMLHLCHAGTESLVSHSLL